MPRLIFFTSSRLKLSNIRHIVKEYNIDIHSFREKTYHANYHEPRLSDRTKLLEDSFYNALIQLKKGFGEKYLNTAFFIEDTSVIIHAFSSKDKEVPGLDIKFWMRKTSFMQLDKKLRKLGNNRKVTVRSDILVYKPLETETLSQTPTQDDTKSFKLEPSITEERQPPPLDVIDSSKLPYERFTCKLEGYIIDKEQKIITNPMFPWLDNHTFNKWFTPLNSPKEAPISTFSIEQADQYDFRKKNIIKMMSFLSIKKKPTHKPLLGITTPQLSLNFNYPSTFILLGPTCAGKTTLASFLAEKYGFYHIEASDFMYYAYYQRHNIDSPIEIIDFAKEALKNEPNIVAKEILKHLEKSSYPSVVISGFRNYREIKWLTKKYPDSNIKSIYINSEQSVRFKRCKKRQRNDFSDEKFYRTDEKQHVMGLRELKPIIRYHIDNNSNLENYYSNFMHQFDSDLKKQISVPASSGTPLEDAILYALQVHYELKQYYSTTEIAKLIATLSEDNKSIDPHHKDNISRYFNQQFFPYYEIEVSGNRRAYRLSNTGYSLALIRSDNEQ